MGSNLFTYMVVVIIGVLNRRCHSAFLRATSQTRFVHI